MAYSAPDFWSDKRRLLPDARSSGNGRWSERNATPSQYGLIEGLGILGRLMSRGILPGGLFRLFHFLRSLPLASPRLLPQAITDWIMGLAMQDYVERRFGVTTKTRQVAAVRLFESLQAALAVYLRSGKVIVALRSGPAAGLNLFVSLRGWLDGAFFSRAGSHLEKLLRRTPLTVTLRIELPPEAEISHLNRLLRRLAPYGDRIVIHVDAKLRELVRIDSSVFHLILE